MHIGSVFSIIFSVLLLHCQINVILSICTGPWLSASPSGYSKGLSHWRRQKIGAWEASYKILSDRIGYSLLPGEPKYCFVFPLDLEFSFHNKLPFWSWEIIFKPHFIPLQVKLCESIKGLLKYRLFLKSMSWFFYCFGSSPFTSCTSGGHTPEELSFQQDSIKSLVGSYLHQVPGRILSCNLFLRVPFYFKLLISPCSTFMSF